jgi:hypothetical protein
MLNVVADIKHAVRLLWRAPSFSLAAVLTLENLAGRAAERLS